MTSKMRSIYIVLLLYIWHCTAISASNDGSGIYEKAASTVVFISSPTQSAARSGSGVITAQDSVLTNCHVVQGATEIVVTFHDGEAQPGTYAGRYGRLDLCLVKVPTGTRRTAKLGKVIDLQPGKAVYALGSPLGLKASISEGVIASIREDDGHKLIQFTAPISPGSSGGGLFNNSGALIGITTSSHSGGQNINFAIPVDYARVLVPSIVANDTLLSSPNVSFKGLPFGVSKEDVLQAFPGVLCRSIDAATIACSGTTDFTSRQASFTALIGARGMFMVFIRISSEDPDEAFADAALAIAERFKWPKDLRPGLLINWDIGNRNEQGVLLAKCDRTNRCQIDPTIPGIEIIIADTRLAKPKGRDF
jgi:hypothetical protein